MDKNNSIKKRTTAVLLVVQICVMALVGCTIGNGNKTGTLTPGSSILPAPKKNITEATTNASQEITVTGVLSYIDRDNKKANFIDISSGVEYEVPYSGGTDFQTKYKTAIAASNLTLGEIYDVICSKKGVATSIYGNPESFEVTGFNNVEIDENKRKISSGASNYVYSDKALVISGEDKIPVSEVLKQDEVTLRGIGNTVYSIVVDKGHGYIKFTGVDAFVGGYAQIGNAQLFNVTEDMMITAGTGTYKVNLKNGSMEATKEVTVEKGEEVSLDFGEYLLPVTQQGSVNFMVTPEGAVMSIDGEEVDYSTPVQLPYGRHTVKLVKNNYKEYTEIIEVNSAYVTKVIDMTATSTTAATTKATQKTTAASEKTTTAKASTTASGSYNIIITSPEGAGVYVDSVYVGTVPCTFRKTAGTKTITLTKNGYNTISYSITVGDSAGNLTYAFPDMVKTQE